MPHKEYYDKPTAASKTGPSTVKDSTIRALDSKQNNTAAPISTIYLNIIKQLKKDALDLTSPNNG